MDENSKLYRRCQRPRPYDLRRKVLLKNFLKEQMSFMPQVNDELENESTVSEENSIHDSSISENHGSSDEGVLHQETADFLNPEILENPNAKDPIVSNSDSILDKQPLMECNPVTPQKPIKAAKVSSFMKLRSSVRRRNSVSKAKHNRVKSPAKKISIAESFRNMFKAAKDTVKVNAVSKTQTDRPNVKKKCDGSKSLAWRLFRPSKDSRRRSKKLCRKISSSELNLVDASGNDRMACSGTSSQSVQTDADWGMDDISSLEQSNILLREENRLLVESLSYFMSDGDISPKKTFRDDVFEDYQPSSNLENKSEWFNFSDNESHRRSKRTKIEACDDTRAPKVLRSKSVQERHERSHSKSSHRTKSMRVSRSRSNASNLDISHSDPNIPSFYSHNLKMNSWHFNTDSQVSIPRVKSPNILRSLPVAYPVRRRSSMPERPHSKKHPRTCRRTGSFHDCLSSGHIPFHALPAEAFY